MHHDQMEYVCNELNSYCFRPFFCFRNTLLRYAVRRYDFFRRCRQGFFGAGVLYSIGAGVSTGAGVLYSIGAGVSTGAGVLYSIGAGVSTGAGVL